MSSDPREVAKGGGTVAGYVVVVVETVVVTTIGASASMILLRDAKDLREVREMRLDGRFSAVIEVVRKVAIVNGIELVWVCRLLERETWDSRKN